MKRSYRKYLHWMMIGLLSVSLLSLGMGCSKETKEKAKEASEKTKDAAQSATEDVKKAAQKTADAAKETTQEMLDKGREKVNEAAKSLEKATEKTPETDPESTTQPARRTNMKALILSADHVEDSELLYPMYRLQEEGFTVTVATPEGKTITGKHGYTIDAQADLSEVQSGEYDVLILPGGKAPETVRESENALRIAREMLASGKVVAAICHGPQVLASAGVLKGRNATGWPGIQEELQDAGAVFRDDEVVVDNNLITSRKPADLPAFMHAVLMSANIQSTQPADAAVGAPQQP